MTAATPRQAADLASAIETVRRLSRTLDMPQRPDAVTITDADDKTLYWAILDAEPMNDGRQDP